MTKPCRLGIALALLAATSVAWAADPPPDPIGPLHVGDSEGNTTTLDAPGMLYLVDFWALGCKPCIVEMPELERLAKEYEPGGRFRLVSIVAAGWEGKDLLQVAQDAGTTLPISGSAIEIPSRKSTWRTNNVNYSPRRLPGNNSKLL